MFPFLNGLCENRWAQVEDESSSIDFGNGLRRFLDLAFASFAHVASNFLFFMDMFVGEIAEVGVVLNPGKVLSWLTKKAHMHSRPIQVICCGLQRTWGKTALLTNLET